MATARMWRARIHRGRQQQDAIAAGVLVGLLVGLVPRLTASASVVLARLVPGVEPVEVRSLAASIGPVVIQNLAAALVIGVYIASLRAQRARVRAEAAEQRTAPLFAVALGVYALADGIAPVAGSLPLMTITVGLVVNHICRGLALGAGFNAQSDGLSWLGSVALLGGLVGGLGASAARQLAFEQANVIAVPVLACAVGLLVVSIATILGPGLGTNLRRLPLSGFAAGLGLTLLAARLLV
jgi:hypothetical protein